MTSFVAPVRIYNKNNVFSYVSIQCELGEDFLFINTNNGILM